MIAAVACVLTSLVGLGGWYWLKLWSLDFWRELSFPFMPVLIGVSVGGVARWWTPAGTFGLAGFAAMLTLVASLVGVAMQSRVCIDSQLPEIASAVYEETIEYARATDGQPDEELLRKAMASTPVSVIGRLAAGETSEPSIDYWSRRNLIHVNWILSRGMVVYGQGGPDRAIFDSTSLVKDVVFVDQEVSRLAGEPVPDEDIPRFRRDELPYLERLLHDQISRPAFETSLIAGVRSRISWGALAFHGFGPFLGLGILWGMIIAYRLARRYSEIEDI